MVPVEIVLLAVIIAVGQANGARLRRTTGGHHVPITSLPCEASIRIDSSHACGGALISLRHILTAAHCVVDDTGEPYESITVETSTDELTKGGIVYQAKSVAWHSEYKGSDPEGVFPHDIAVLTLTEPIKPSDTQKPLKLPSKDLASRKNGVFGGFGGSEQEQTKLRLECVSTDILPRNECQKFYGSFKLHENQICTLLSTGSKLAAGDSGGPLISEGKIVGVVSWIDRQGRRFPDVCVNVYKYLKFIERAMEGKIVSHIYAPK